MIPKLSAFVWVVALGLTIVAAPPILAVEAQKTATPSDETKTYKPSEEAQAKFDALKTEIGDPETGSSSVKQNSSDSFAALFFKMLASLALVILLAVGSMRFLRRLRRGPGMGGMGSSGTFLFEVMETCHLGPGQRIVAIRMQNKVGMVGVSKENISFMGYLEGEPLAMEKAMRKEGNAVQFGDSLTQVLERFKKPKNSLSANAERP
jgi:flagellar biogenesis protein FliO